MRIFIITMDDPVQTKTFISQIIRARKDDIVGLAVSKGDRMTIQKNKSKVEYLFSLLLIMGPWHFAKNSLITILFKLQKKLSGIFPGLIKNPSIKTVAEQYGIQTWEIKTPNSKKFLEELRKLNVDLIINQSQNILKKELLVIPKIGVINRHNALLPKNRGRLTPFWVLYNEEKETGVSIHFVTEDLDAGDIIVQKRFPIENEDNFNTIVKKNYQLAPVAMLEAIEVLASGQNGFLKNDPALATYNSTPTLQHAWRYRRKRFSRMFR